MGEFKKIGENRYSYSIDKDDLPFLPKYNNGCIGSGSPLDFMFVSYNSNYGRIQGYFPDFTKGYFNNVLDQIQTIFVNEKKKQVGVKWKDNSITYSNCSDEDYFDLEVGVFIAIMRKRFPSRSQTYKWLEKSGKFAKHQLWMLERGTNPEFKTEGNTTKFSRAYDDYKDGVIMGEAIASIDKINKSFIDKINKSLTEGGN